MIISYEMLLRNIDAVQKCGFDLLICDEAHRLKNSSTKTATAMMSVGTKRRIALTGTPIQNDLQEFFAIVEFCNPGILGSAAVSLVKFRFNLLYFYTFFCVQTHTPTINLHTINLHTITHKITL